MNRIFKVIWNKTTQRTEVVSELARGMAKSSSSSVVNTTKLVKPVLKLSLLSICLGYPQHWQWQRQIPMMGVLD